MGDIDLVATHAVAHALKYLSRSNVEYTNIRFFPGENHNVWLYERILREPGSELTSSAFRAVHVSNLDYNPIVVAKEILKEDHRLDAAHVYRNARDVEASAAAHEGRVVEEAAKLVKANPDRASDRASFLSDECGRLKSENERLLAALKRAELAAEEWERKYRYVTGTKKR